MTRPSAGIPPQPAAVYSPLKRGTPRPAARPTAQPPEPPEPPRQSQPSKEIAEFEITISSRNGWRVDSHDPAKLVPGYYLCFKFRENDFNQFFQHMTGGDSIAAADPYLHCFSIRLRATGYFEIEYAPHTGHKVTNGLYIHTTNFKSIGIAESKAIAELMGLTAKLKVTRWDSGKIVATVPLLPEMGMEFDGNLSPTGVPKIKHAKKIRADLPPEDPPPQKLEATEDSPGRPRTVRFRDYQFIIQTQPARSLAPEIRTVYVQSLTKGLPEVRLATDLEVIFLDEVILKGVTLA